VGFTDIVDQDANVEVLNGAGNGVVVSVVEVFGKVDRDEFGLDGVFGFQVGSDLRKLGFCSGDEDNVVAFSCELECKLFAYAVGGTSDECPSAFGCIFFDLFFCFKCQQ